MHFGQIWSELRRRKVVRAAIIYAVVAWIAIQAAATIFPALNIPSWGVSLVVAIALLGLPIALVLSWMFDLSPDKSEAAGATPVAPALRPSATPHAGSNGQNGAEHTHGVAASARTAAAPEPRSIAVLPFVDMSAAGDSEFFSDGITEEILNALTRVRELHVASRTSSFSFKGKDTDISDIAAKLKVAHVLEGSVRRAGDRLRITAQLIEAQNGYHLWSETYDRELADIFEVQDDIARSIVDALRVELDLGGSRSLVSGATEDIEAYTLYLKGRHVYNKFRRGDLQKSIGFYEQALAKDPDYARAYAGIADSLMSLADDWLAPDEAYPRARTAAAKAVALDDTLAEAHTALGKVLGWYDWNFDSAELHLRRAVANNPSYAEGHYALGTILPPNGHLEEGLTEIRLAVSLDPLSSEFLGWVSRFLIYLGRYEEALDHCLQTIELDPLYYYAYIRAGSALLAMGRPEEALTAFRNEAAHAGGVVAVRAYEAQALAALERTDEAREILEELARGGADYVRPEFLAAGYAALGDTDRAFAELEKARAARSAGLIYLHVDPMYAPLRTDPRFASMVSGIGLRHG